MAFFNSRKEFTESYQVAYPQWTPEFGAPFEDPALHKLIAETDFTRHAVLVVGAQCWYSPGDMTYRWCRLQAEMQDHLPPAHGEKLPAFHGKVCRAGKKNCFVCARGDTKMHRCSRCQSVYYCSAQCQKQDWAAHKQVCRPRQDRSREKRLDIIFE